VAKVAETAYRGSIDLRQEIFLSERRIEPSRAPVLEDTK
jgi:hypothetical protein